MKRWFQIVFFSVFCFSGFAQNLEKTADRKVEADSFKRDAFAWPSLIQGSPLQNPLLNVLKLDIVKGELGFKAIFRNEDKWLFGALELSAKSTSGMSTLIENAEFAPGVSGGIELNGIWRRGDRSILWGGLKLNGSGNKYYLINPDKEYDDQLTERTFSGFSINPSINYYLNSSGRVLALGLSGNLGRQDNISTLTKLVISEEKKVTSTNGTVRSMSQKYVGYAGDYRSFGSTSGKLELMYNLFHGKRYFSHAYVEGVIPGSQELLSYYNVGVGMYTTGIIKADTSKNAGAKDKAVSLGLQFHLNDVENVNQSELDWPGRTRVSFVIGLPFASVSNFN